MKAGLPVGETQHHHYTVAAELTVPRILPGSNLEEGEPVLASGMLLAICEHAAWHALGPYREPTEAAVGWGFELSHLAPAVAGDALDLAVTPTDVTIQHNEIATVYDVSWRIVATIARIAKPVGILQHNLRVQARDHFRCKLPVTSAA